MNIKYLIALALAGLLAMSSIAYAGESLNAYFTVNYITYLNPNGQVNNYYIEYTLSIYNNEPRSIPLNVSMSILPYSSVIYTSPAATAINNNMVTWIITLRPYSEEVLDVRFKPVYTLLPIATLDYGVLVNGSSVNSTVVNGNVGTNVEIFINTTNQLPFPIVTTITLTRQSGLFYEYNITPTITQDLLGYEVDYWLFNTENVTSMSLNMITENMGPWHSIRINPITVQTSIDLNESIKALNESINSLNSTLNQLVSFSSTVINASSLSSNYTTQFFQLIALLNQTAQVLGASAYLINSTLMVEGLLQAQLVELKVALSTEGQILGTEVSVISQIRSLLGPIANNQQSYINELNTLKQDLLQIESSTNNATLISEINNAITIINQLEGSLTALTQLYNGLGAVQDELTSTQAQVNQAVNGLNYAIAAANESETLIISISNNLYLLHNELLNLTNQLLATYLSISSYQTRALSYMAQVNNYEEEIRSMIVNDEVEETVLNTLAKQYLSYVSINETNVSTDVTVEETFIINMPSIVNTQYLLQLINATTAQGNETQSPRTIGIVVNGYYGYFLIMGIAVSIMLILILIRKFRY
ncbi:hypothetical protein [Vulcanisaeta souniana]|uniref:Uncharacterized protein n=1 Tax=Vulcanisaeta souniana JCM 11219 TaxID=1293586 RepID=A0A830E9I3_9CREN|nr:hypothetical protein [Vulcanisaeta souniana]BDR92579.1 hypothetical protein Vsou_16720 [Vulcanisaeta souniana JCM 11219]GGI82810.1 hypothetical protein GCM10007112_19450 [Vulcanisaeta souniana JCM 11219]